VTAASAHVNLARGHSQSCTKIFATLSRKVLTLDEGLQAALVAKDIPCMQELLRYGADINTCILSFAKAVSASDQALV
jgi:hypothetical protein